jgi:hypothetical protein
VVADEEFFLASMSGPSVVERPTDPRQVTAARRRWWTVDELRATDEPVYPRRLGDLLASVRPGDWDGVTRSIS